MLGLVVAVAVVAMAAGVGASRLVVSPGDAAARSKPPTPSELAVPVERRQLVSRVVTRGEITLGGAVRLSIPSADGAVVTERPPVAGTALAEGDLLVEVSERPVFVLTGTVPMYSDVLPGSTGVDVEQLEAALQRLGFAPGSVDDTFDGATESAIAAFYEAKGYAAPGPSPEDAAELEEARRRVSAAQAEVAGPGGGAVAEATVAVRDAERALAAARGAARVARQEADGAVSTAAAAADAARRDDEAASAALAAAPGSGLSDPERRELEAAAGSARVARIAAQNGLVLAETQRDQIIGDAQASIDAASDQVALAQRRHAGVAGGASASAGRGELDAAVAHLAEVDARIGTAALRSELIFVPTLPATISSVEVGLGSPVDGVLAEASQAAIEARTRLPERARDLVETGDPVRVAASDGAFEATGSIVAIADDAEPGGFPARVLVDAEGLDPLRIRGASVRVTIPVGRTDGPVLVVPVAAIFSAADGSARVEVVRGDTTERVTVRPGLSADGYVEVEAAGARLEEGDMVVVGRGN